MEPEENFLILDDINAKPAVKKNFDKKLKLQKDNQK